MLVKVLKPYSNGSEFKSLSCSSNADEKIVFFEYLSLCPRCYCQNNDHCLQLCDRFIKVYFDSVTYIFGEKSIIDDKNSERNAR